MSTTNQAELLRLTPEVNNIQASLDGMTGELTQVKSGLSSVVSQVTEFGSELPKIATTMTDIQCQMTRRMVKQASRWDGMEKRIRVLINHTFQEMIVKDLPI